MPLGKLTAAQVRAGYEALSRIEAAIKVSESGTGSILIPPAILNLAFSQAGSSTLEATNDFYTRIPSVSS